MRFQRFCLFLLQDDEDLETEEEEGGLSKSGKELKKLLGKSNGLNESEEEDDDDDSDDVSPLQFPTQLDLFNSEAHSFDYTFCYSKLVLIQVYYSECRFIGGGDELQSRYEF